MGLGQSKKYLSESDMSDDDLDCEFFLNSEQPQIDGAEVLPGNTLDAVKKPLLAPVEDLMSFEKLVTIEAKLDDFEIISLIYLLYEDSELALEELKNVIKLREKGILYNWVHSDAVENAKKQKKLIEALCIIQNYQILVELGYSKQELQQFYMPFHYEISMEVKKMRKVLYLIAEKLTKDQTLKFIQILRRKLCNLDINCPKYDSDYIEFYFLHCELSGVNINDIRQGLKSINTKESLYDKLDYIKPIERNNTILNNNYEQQIVEAKLKSHVIKANTTKDNTYLPIPGSFDDTSSYSQVAISEISEKIWLDANRYSIDLNNPGVVLIINQESFYTETEPAYKDLLHENKEEIQLTSRDGTNVDRDRLEHVFRQMGFTVIVHENMPHYKMLDTIKNVTDTVSDESSLIICILSHGDKGVVYGSNSCKVKVSEIQYIMCKKNKKLDGKPKVLILQSCQGEKCQNIEEEDNDDYGYATDGPRRTNPIVDLLTFWATIPGFAAIRNKDKGSWFIQALCEEIEKGHSKLHFSDICTRAVKNVTNQEWKEKSKTNVMTPLVETTLTQSFFLPPLKATSG